MIWILLHTKFSPIEKYRIMKLLLNFTEEADLLQQHSSDINLTKSVLWMYRIINGKYEIELRTGGHLTSSQEED
ncbi:cell division protein FtsK, partial [Streptococcus suis]